MSTKEETLESRPSKVVKYRFKVCMKYRRFQRQTHIILKINSYVAKNIVFFLIMKIIGYFEISP